LTAHAKVGRGQKRKKPRDLNELAKRILDESTGDAPAEPESEKNRAAVELGRRGGLKGGKARAAKLTAKQRSEIAKKAARARLVKIGLDRS
jgi:hypothetical protein